MIKLNELEIKVISLVDSTRRLTFSKKNSEKIKFSFFDAYTGEDKEFQKLFENSDIYEHAETYDIGSVIGCARSHRSEGVV
jgi:GR25 family glycosyltransferase involved in LPS biosynthesis